MSRALGFLIVTFALAAAILAGFWLAGPWLGLHPRGGDGGGSEGGAEQGSGSAALSRAGDGGARGGGAALNAGMPAASGGASEGTGTAAGPGSDPDPGGVTPMSRFEEERARRAALRAARREAGLTAGDGPSGARDRIDGAFTPAGSSGFDAPGSAPLAPAAPASGVQMPVGSARTASASAVPVFRGDVRAAPTPAGTEDDAGDDGRDLAGDDTSQAADDPESDRQAPTIEGFRFDPPEIPDGGTTTLFVEATDNLSGVKNLNGTIRSPSGGATLPFAAAAEGTSVVVAAKIAIPKQAEVGRWSVAYVRVMDKANNALVLNFTDASLPAGAALQVSSDDSDSTPPQVLSVSVERPVVGAGERNLVRIEIEDDRSGVAQVWGSFQSPSKRALVGFSGRLNQESGVWEADLAIPAGADCGEWKLQHLRVTDKANNVAHFNETSPPIAGVGFVVATEGDCDSTPPELVSLTLSPNVVSNEAQGEVTVTVTVRDQGGGARSVFGWVEGPVATSGQPPRIHFACSQSPGDPQGPWVGKIAVPQFSARGFWAVASLQTYDKANNLRVYTKGDPTLGGAGFEVQ